MEMSKKLCGISFALQPHCIKMEPYRYLLEDNYEGDKVIEQFKFASFWRLQGNFHNKGWLKS